VVWQFCPENVKNVRRGVVAEKVGADLPVIVRNTGRLVRKL